MTMRCTITLFCSSLNEQSNLKVFLEKHKWADEIIILDSGSTDGSVDLCKKYGRKVFFQKLEGNYSRRSAFAVEHAETDWCFFSDPDEIFTDELKNEIFDILEKGTECVAFENRRVNFFMNKPLRHGGWSGNGLKMFRRDKVRFEGDSYHEHPIIDGKIGQLKGEVWHYASPNIHWILQKFNYISEFDHKTYYDQFGELSARRFKWLILTKPLKNFWKTYIKKQGYKDGLHGFIYAMMIWAFDVIRICKYGERYLVKNPHVHTLEELPDPWACRKH